MEQENIEYYAKVHSIESFGTVDGPGIRYVLFLQGCSLKCKYCHNRDTWDIHGGEFKSLDEIYENILRYKNYINNGGVTVTGGEPLLQYEFLMELFKRLKKESILFLLKKNSEVISKNADSDLLIKKLIFPSLQSPCGLLREQSCDFISKFKIKNEELLEELIKILCFLMEKDPQLSVRLYACIALGNFFDNEKVRNMIKGNVKKILEISC